MTTRGGRWLLAAVAALALAWAAVPAGVPIYDGIGNPDEPYRYVNAPAGAKPTPPPTPAIGKVRVQNGKNVAQYCNSAESGPQISVFVPAGSLGVPAGTTSVVVEARPQAPSAPLPTDGTIVGNVYHVTATAGGHDVAVTGTGNNAPTLQMRAPTAQQPGPVFEHRTAGGWQTANTVRVGNDVYQASAPGFGDWALVQLAHSGSGSGGPNAGLLAGGIGLLVVSLLILAVRVRRTRSTGGSPSRPT